MKSYLVISAFLACILLTNMASAEINDINASIPYANDPESGIIENPNIGVSRQLVELNNKLDELSKKMENISSDTIHGNINASTIMLSEFRDDMRGEMSFLSSKIILGLAGAMILSFAVYELLKIKFSYTRKVKKELNPEAKA